MPDAREPQSVIDAAEQAAARGDSGSAERLLREAIILQEAELGPFHPDLANTLNNLGVVCEFTNKLADAEQCYRRAFAIATAALDPDHPFVATSGKNLRDFCNARGIAVEPPSSPPVVTADPPQAPSGGHHSQEQPSSDEPRSTGSTPPSPRSLVIGILSVVALVLVVVFVPRSWFSSDAQPESSAVDTASRPAQPSTPALTPQPPAPKDAPPTTKDAPATPKEAPPAAASPARERRLTPDAAPASLTVVEARLCRRLSTDDWRCDGVNSPVDTGPLVFYTRVKASSDTTVLHRWYQGDRVHQVVELPIRANPGDGYRTYSRNTINSGSAGDWRVELRTKDGILLHEERFVVR